MTTFPNPFVRADYGDGLQPIPLEEIRMLLLLQEISGKPNWYEKIFKEEIAEKWKKEMKQSRASDAMITYVFDNLKFFASKRNENGYVYVNPIHSIFQADYLIDKSWKQKLLEQVSVLENVPSYKQDWHPGSNNQVLDLVHPSLYCLVEGVTPIAVKPMDQRNRPMKEWIGTGQVEKGIVLKTGELNEYESQMFTSKTYQWLPSEFQVDEKGKVKIQSYINNLHPYQHRGLYSTIANIFEKFVPLFEQCLYSLLHPAPRLVPVDMYELYEEGKEEEESEEDEEEKEKEAEDSLESPSKKQKTEDDAETKDKQEMEDEDSEEKEENEEMDGEENEGDEEEEEDDEEEDDGDRRKLKPIVFNAKFEAPAEVERLSLKGKSLQVIVKLANIILTPENPRYEGGSWHVEGMKNENIVASGIYYYKQENISESVLQFRQGVCEPDYEQSDDRGVEYVYGLTNEGELNQQLGGVVTMEDRCIVFPNIYQHRVIPFELQDKTKAGYRKILVFFLTDPTKPVMSTARVPPQQPDWMTQTLITYKCFGKQFPDDVISIIVNYLGPLNWKSATEHREELMKERKYLQGVVNEQFVREFSLCEH